MLLRQCVISQGKGLCDVVAQESKELTELNDPVGPFQSMALRQEGESQKRHLKIVLSSVATVLKETILSILKMQKNKKAINL